MTITKTFFTSNKAKKTEETTETVEVPEVIKKKVEEINFNVSHNYTDEQLENASIKLAEAVINGESLPTVNITQKSSVTKKINTEIMKEESSGETIKNNLFKGKEKGEENISALDRLKALKGKIPKEQIKNHFAVKEEVPKEEIKNEEVKEEKIKEEETVKPVIEEKEVEKTVVKETVEEEVVEEEVVEEEVVEEISQPVKEEKEVVPIPEKTETKTEILDRKSIMLVRFNHNTNSIEEVLMDISFNEKIGLAKMSLEVEIPKNMS